MQTKEYRTVDKTNWHRGAWDHEPDKAQWQDPATGLPCLIVRGPGGALCGYVGVTEAHPWYRKGDSAPIGACSDQCNEEMAYHDHTIGGRLRVHGGITFADACRPNADEASGICHLPEPGEPDHVWWFGFDCAHLDDLTPKYADERDFCRDVYRDIDYVREQVTALAKQLADAKD